jgi:FMN phosphatase YigB (HAD superfamily)
MALPEAQGPRFRPEHEIAARSLQEVLTTKGVALDEREALRHLRDAWAAFVADAALHREVTPSWWNRIHENASGVVLVSDIDKDAAEMLLGRLQLRVHFDALILSEVERAYKPNPVLYRRAAESLDASPGDCLFVSDSTLDLVGARKAGMEVVLVQRGFRVSSVPPPKDTVVLESLELLPNVLRQRRTTGPSRGSG